MEKTLFKYGYKNEYDKLKYYDTNTYYIILDENTQCIYKGNNKISENLYSFHSEKPEWKDIDFGILYIVYDLININLYIKGDTENDGLIWLSGNGLQPETIKDIQSFDENMIIDSTEDFSNSDDKTIPTTEAVKNKISAILSNNMPLMNGEASAGAANEAARADHIHPIDTSRLAADLSKLAVKMAIDNGDMFPVYDTELKETKRVFYSVLFNNIKNGIMDSVNAAISQGNVAAARGLYDESTGNVILLPSDFEDKSVLALASDIATALANYYTAEEVNTLVSAIPKFSIEVVTALPTENISSTTVYLLMTNPGDTSGQLYTEYIYVAGRWEKLGEQKVDLTGYATEEWVEDNYIPITNIINNLTSDDASKVLSAAQGTVLKALIDALTKNKLDASALTYETGTGDSETAVLSQKEITNLYNTLNDIISSHITQANNNFKDVNDNINTITDFMVNDVVIKTDLKNYVLVTDIVNNLASNASNKPLSAAQGAALKALINAIIIPTKLSELAEDSTHRVVTDTEKATWNAKSNFSGAYADLTGKPTKVSAFENDKGYLTEYTESDPTVPAWAKEEKKPSYTKSEVGLGNVDNVKQYSASNPPPYPVQSVNGKAGAVQLSASDVGAVPNSQTITITGVDADGVTHTWTVYGVVSE